MALHPDFPVSPYETLLPDQRWFPAAEELRSTAYERLLPPLVAKIRESVRDRLELAFAAFLDAAPDVRAFAKNYLAVGFRLDYVKADGDLSTYTPDFIVRATDGKVWIIETKGREEMDLPQTMARLRQWCADATQASKEEGGTQYGFVYVDQESFERHPPVSFASLTATFTVYR